MKFRAFSEIQVMIEYNLCWSTGESSIGAASLASGSEPPETAKTRG